MTALSRCAYVYCHGYVSKVDTLCPVCGYPVDASLASDSAFAVESLPDQLPQTIIDMHQIVPKLDGSWAQQLDMNGRLNIEHLLLQSVPSKVASLANNEDLRELVKKNDNVSISQFTDPRIPLVRRKLRRYARAGIRVIKLLPCLGYEPDNPRFDKFWATMEQLGMTAMVHTGFISARHKAEERRAGVYLNSRFGRPIYFDRVARKFPDLNVILCHMGGGAWYEEAAQMVTQHDNVWGDVAGPGIAALRRLVDQRIDIDWSKVFWGNDSPAICYAYNLRLVQRIVRDAGQVELLEGIVYGHGRKFCIDAGLINAQTPVI